MFVGDVYPSVGAVVSEIVVDVVWYVSFIKAWGMHILQKPNV